MFYCGAISAMVLACAAQEAARDVHEFAERIRQVEAERARGNLAAAESILADVEKTIERHAGASTWRASILEMRGLLRDDEGLPAEAIPFYERALTILRAQQSPDIRVLGLTLANVASARADCGNAALGLSLSEEAMTTLGAARRPDFATALYAHGIALHAMNRNNDALRDLREALAIWTAEAKPDFAQVALIQEAIATCLEDLGYVKKAEAAERDSLAIRSRYFGPSSLGYGTALNNLGVMLAREQRYSEAEELFQKSTATFAQLGESGAHQLPGVLGNLGKLYSLQAARGSEYHSKAEKVYRRKLEIEQELFGASDVRVSSTLEALGEILYRQRSYNEAAALYRRGLTLQQASFGETDPRTEAAEKRYRILAKKITGEVGK